MGYCGPRQRSTNLKDGFSNRRVPEELSSRGVSVTGGDADGYEGTLHSPTCQVNRDHTGGGKPPSPIVPPVQHNGALEGSEWAARHHLSV